MTTDSTDLLHGANAIAVYIDVPPRRAYYLLENGQIPAAKLGDKWIARKSQLDAFFDSLLGHRVVAEAPR